MNNMENLGRWVQRRKGFPVGRTEEVSFRDRNEKRLRNQTVWTEGFWVVDVDSETQAGHRDLSLQA